MGQNSYLDNLEKYLLTLEKNKDPLYKSSNCMKLNILYTHVELCNLRLLLIVYTTKTSFMS